MVYELKYIHTTNLVPWYTDKMENDVVLYGRVSRVQYVCSKSENFQ